MSAAMADGLTSEERVLLEQIAAEGNPAQVRRAGLLLRWGEGLPPGEIAPRVGLSAGRVRYWLRAFQERRMGVFPAGLVEAAPESASPKEGPPGELKMAHGVPPVPAIPEPPKHPGLEADDSMAEAARKTFRLHFQRMLYHEPGTRLGQDIEALHDMRVATRRMRAAFRVFGDYLDVERLRPVLKGLRRTGRILGAVRDLDVFWEKTQRYLEALPPERQDELEPLYQAWQAERGRARERMLSYLDGKRYARFTERFGEFLEHPGRGSRTMLSADGSPRPHHLRHVVPVVVYQRYATMLAYDEWVSGPDLRLEQLHQLRIAAKRLRYVLEFFREVLAPVAEHLIEQLKRLQDHLGDLQDAVVASGLLRDFLTWGTWGQVGREDRPTPTEPIVAPGVAAYLAARQAELELLLESFPQVWAHFLRAEFHQALALAVSFSWSGG